MLPLECAEMGGYKESVKLLQSAQVRWRLRVEAEGDVIDCEYSPRQRKQLVQWLGQIS